MEPMKLYLENGGGKFVSISAHLCGKCRRIWESADSAGRCCTCSYCGKACDWRHSVSHKECFDAAIRSSDSKAMEKAILVEDYDGPFMYNDRYFSEKEELIEYLESDDLSVPEYVFAAKYVEPHLDTEEILQHIQENDMHEDWEPIECGPLEAAIDAWNDANKANGTWYEDRTKKVRLRASGWEGSK